MVLQYMRCAPTWHVMNMWIAHRYSRVHMKSPKFKWSKYEVCGVKIYTIQLHLKMSNLTFILLGFKVLRELMSLCSARWRSKSLLPLVLRMPVMQIWFRVVRLVEVGCNRSTWANLSKKSRRPSNCVVTLNGLSKRWKINKGIFLRQREWLRRKMINIDAKEWWFFYMFKELQRK